MTETKFIKIFRKIGEGENIGEIEFTQFYNYFIDVICLKYNNWFFKKFFPVFIFWYTGKLRDAAIDLTLRLFVKKENKFVNLIKIYDKYAIKNLNNNSITTKTLGAVAAKYLFSGWANFYNEAERDKYNYGRKKHTETFEKWLFDVRTEYVKRYHQQNHGCLKILETENNFQRAMNRVIGNSRLKNGDIKTAKNIAADFFVDAMNNQPALLNSYIREHTGAQCKTPEFSKFEYFFRKLKMEFK